MLDVGCFHGFTDAQRTAYAAALTALTEPGASLLMFAFVPGFHLHRRGAPRSAVERTFTGWTLVSNDPAITDGMPAPLKKSNPRWFRLTRN